MMKLKPADEADLLSFVYEAKSELLFLVRLFFFHVRFAFVSRHVDCFVIYEFNSQKDIHVDSDSNAHS